MKMGMEGEREGGWDEDGDERRKGGTGISKMDEKDEERNTKKGRKGGGKGSNRECRLRYKMEGRLDDPMNR